MIPSTSPCFTSKSTSLNAQNVSFLSRRINFHGARSIGPSTLRNAFSRSRCPIRYSLPKPCALIAISLISRPDFLRPSSFQLSARNVSPFELVVPFVTALAAIRFHSKRSQHNALPKPAHVRAAYLAATTLRALAFFDLSCPNFIHSYFSLARFKQSAGYACIRSNRCPGYQSLLSFQLPISLDVFCSTTSSALSDCSSLRTLGFSETLNSLFNKRFHTRCCKTRALSATYQLYRDGPLTPDQPPCPPSSGRTSARQPEVPPPQPQMPASTPPAAGRVRSTPSEIPRSLQPSGSVRTAIAT